MPVNTQQGVIRRLIVSLRVANAARFPQRKLLTISLEGSLDGALRTEGLGLKAATELTEILLCKKKLRNR